MCLLWYQQFVSVSKVEETGKERVINVEMSGMRARV